ncbi:hypothetical protein JW992_06155 [candidate division KSB1 bacterium]|nr:hypothetical protein [candidate division KSB1 bacterium]
MTSHERFEQTLRYEIPDRLPLDLIWPRAEILAALRNHFQTESTEEVYQRLGIDFRWIGLSEVYPDFDRRVNGRLQGEMPGAGNAVIFHDAQTFEDAWGVVQRVGDDGKYLEWKSGPLVECDDLSGWKLPTVVWPSAEEIQKNLDPFRETVTITEIAFPFKVAWHLCGMEGLMMRMLSDLDFVEELYDRLYARQTENAVLAAQSGFDIIALVGDIAGQNGMMFSPRLFRQLDLPRMRALVQAVKSAAPQVKVLYHSDGDMEAVIPMLIECGVDILNPIQSACMDPTRIKKVYGDRLTLHGTLSVQDTVPCGSAADVRAEVKHRIETVGYNGGFIISPENSIPYDAPLENVLALYQAARDYDYRALRERQS